LGNSGHWRSSLLRTPWLCNDRRQPSLVTFWPQQSRRSGPAWEAAMAAHRGKFVAYFRVSTDRQGKSGLGLEAQREAVLNYLNGGSWALVKEFVEVESGKHSDRPQLTAALTACKKHRAKLVIAKLDRLSRNLAFIATLMDSGVEFVAVD